MPDEVLLDNPLAIVGDEDAVLGFRALGFKIYSVTDLMGFKTALDDIIENKVGICLVQDNIYRAGQEHIDNFKQLAFPVFIPFSKTAQNNLLQNLIRNIRLRATGAL
jgi:vacuolar-type H+-ATPase subunit F/Vma7